MERGIVSSRSRAQAEIAAGRVFVDGAAETRPSAAVRDGAKLELREAANPWVSRGALKLIHALEAFAISPAGLVVLDAGASTGGFTEVCLARGARRVYAVDVGRDQLHPRLKADPRVVSLEETDVRALGRVQIPEPPDLVVADLSFISLAKALEPALDLAAPRAKLVALIKPQFEAGRAAVGKRGVVKDPAAREGTVAAVRDWLTARGWRILGVVESPVAGGTGNREHLIGAER